jgi:V/A-type H+-transporting ATPase subunit I
MAISKIKKIEIIGLKEDRGRLLELLQKMGIVELISVPGEVSLNAEALNAADTLEIDEAIAYLAGFQAKPGPLEGMVRIKPLLYEQQFKEILAGFNYQGIILELSKLRSHLKNLLYHSERLIQEKHILLPWRKLKIPLDQMHDTSSCAVLLGALRKNDYENLLDECKKEGIDLFCEAVGQNKASLNLAMIYFREDFLRLEGILKTHHFEFASLSRHSGTVRDRLEEIGCELAVLEKQVAEAKNKIAGVAENRFKLMVIYDYLANIRNALQADNHLAKQQFTFILSGWIRERDTRTLEKALAVKFQDAALFLSEPKNEEVPVDLDNHPIVEPFEFITKIYGMPKYNEIDPTPFLAPFFFLYFGFCVSDVGYGLAIILICWFALKKFRLGPQGLRFFRLFMFCGVSTVAIGALTGSCFGNLLDVAAESNRMILPLKKFKDSLVILDPLKQPTELLGVALCLGIIQVWFGNIVAAIGNIKNKRYLDILLDQATMLTLLFGLTGLGFNFLKLIGNRNTALFQYSALIGAIGIVITQGRFEKGIGGKLFYGVFTLYNALSGYLSDILSYSRLWALGLVTGVMANTINLISVQFAQIAISVMPFVNRVAPIKILVSSIILLVIFIAGHAVSFLMNLLGAFVHPVRLQFVEFFSKFFRSGGSAFKPFRVESKYINLG